MVSVLISGLRCTRADNIQFNSDQQELWVLYDPNTLHILYKMKIILGLTIEIVQLDNTCKSVGLSA